MKNTEADQAEPTYRIGAVSRLTGVAPDTLRVWERRYGAVAPPRSDRGTRLYSQEDVERLALIKRLVDRGDAISSVANLSGEQLKDRVKGAPLAEVAADLKRPCRVAALGNTLPDRVTSETAEADQLEWVGLYSERERFLSETPGLKADVIVLEYTTIQPDQIREIGKLLLHSGAERAVVIYGFAAHATLECLESPQIIPVRGPVDRSELRRCCLAPHAQPSAASAWSTDAGVELSGSPPARRFNAATLSRIAAAPVAVRCECPHHLVDLISNLAAFEDYNQECQIRNLDDAALHAFLHAITARARSLLEAALARLIAADNIEI